MIKTCILCNKDYKTEDKRRKFCGLDCYHQRERQEPNSGAFSSGLKVWNKGLKGIHLSPKSEFKKGIRGINWKPVGSITNRKDKYGTNRVWIKIKEPNIWQEYSKYLWIKSGRKLTRGLVLHHINNRSDDDRIENLILVSRKEHPTLHNKWNTKN